MRLKNKLISIVLLAFASNAQASYQPLLGTDLSNLSVYASGPITMATAVKVGGNMQGATTITLAGNGTVGGNIEAGSTITLAAGIDVGGNVESVLTTTIAADVNVAGNIQAGTTATLAAGINVDGNIEAGSTIVIAAGVEVIGDVWAGSTVAIATGSILHGDVDAGTTATIAAGVTFNGTLTANSTKGTPTAPVVTSKAALITSVQADVYARGQGTLLTSDFGTNNEMLEAGTYTSINYLTIAMGNTLTLDGKGVDGSWVFNIANNLNFGIGSRVILENVTDNSSILWNVLGETTAGLTSLGANSEVRGHIFTKGAVLAEANTLIAGIGNDCGGVFSATSTITFAANGVIGLAGCTNGAVITPTKVPEPASVWLLGLGFLGLVIARRKKV